MELSGALRHSFRVFASRSVRCECSTRYSHSSVARRKLQTTTISTAAAIPSRRGFSTTPARCVVTTSDPEMKISDSVTHSASPPPATPRQQVQSYIDDVQRIIDGYDLKNRQNMYPRSYESLVHGLARAETQINAPNVNPESFSPMLRSLQVMVSSILETRFPGKSIPEIVSGIGETKLEPLPPQAPRAGVPSALNKAFAHLSRPSRPVSELDSIMDTTTSTSSPRRFGEPRSVTSIVGRFHEAERFREAIPEPIIRLSSSIGKQVDVTGYTDVTRAFQRMEAICSRNRVRADVRSQRFHIRKGMLRKNLRIIRWRKLFKEGFVAECARVQKMRKQGW